MSAPNIRIVLDAEPQVTGTIRRIGGL